MIGCPFDKLTSIGCIRPDFLETRKLLSQQINQPPANRAILTIGFRDKGFEYQAFGVYYQVTLAALDLFACIVAPTAPFSVVLTDWLSMIAALGVGSRPSS